VAIGFALIDWSIAFSSNKEEATETKIATKSDLIIFLFF
jgi:hypothetical protein